MERFVEEAPERITKKDLHKVRNLKFYFVIFQLDIPPDIVLLFLSLVSNGSNLKMLLV